MAVEDDVLVVGGGLAGLAAGIAAARAGAGVRVVSGAESTLRQASGLVDVLGYPPGDATGNDGGSGADRGSDVEGSVPTGPLVDPFGAVADLHDAHPYATVGVEAVRAGLALFDEAVEGYAGDHTERNALVPTHGGTVKPTARYPESTAAGLASDDRDVLLVGFEAVPDFDAPLAAAHLAATGVPFDVRGATIAFPGGFREDAKLTRYAHALDEDEPLTVEGDSLRAREALAEAVKPHVGAEARVGFPALLGHDDPATVRADLADALGAAVFEVPMGPPSLPGMRLAEQLAGALREAGGRLVAGVPAVDYDAAAGRVETVYLDRNGAQVPHSAGAVVLATGGLVGEGVSADRESVREPLFGCHVPQPDDRYDWFAGDAFGDHPFARFGVRVDGDCRPLDAGGDPEFANLHAAGSVIGGYDFAAECSGAGVSLATGRLAGERAAEVTA
jgi:glycerol-3-phosphate dehydrogenase subunit B